MYVIILHNVYKLAVILFGKIYKKAFVNECFKNNQNVNQNISGFASSNLLGKFKTIFYLLVYNKYI